MDYLLRRNGYYYFRVCTPRDLLPVIKQREIKKSLKTRRLQHAKSLAKVWGFRVEKLFFMLRSGMLTDDQIRAIVNEFFHKTLKEAEENRAETGFGMIHSVICSGEPEDPIDQILEDYCYLASELRENLARNKLKDYMNSAYELFEEKGIVVEKGSREHKILCREYMKALIRALEVDEERVRGNYNNWYDRERSRRVVEAEPTSPPVRKGKTLKELINLYLAEKKPKWKPETYDEYSRTFQMLLEYLGDVDVTSIRGEDFVRFRDFLMILPPNKAKVKAFKGRTLHEIEQMLREKPSTKIMAEKTRNSLLERVTGLMQWAEDMDHVRKNLAKRLAVRTKKRSAREDWKPYDKEDLGRLFQSPWYTEPHELWEIPRRWIPVIALYTGMRLSEICQLFLSDLQQDGRAGVYYFNVEEYEGEDEERSRKRVKSSAGVRYVPIHPTLIELGLLKYVDRLRQAGEERLWPMLPTYEKRQYYSFYFGKWYQYNNKHFITTEKKKSFRSFRRTFRSELYRHGVSPQTANDIMGHKQGNIGEDRYSTPRIENAYEAILKLDYGLDFSTITFPV